jgi:hypothetical protein
LTLLRTGFQRNALPQEHKVVFARRIVLSAALSRCMRSVLRKYYIRGRSGSGGPGEPRVSHDWIDANTATTCGRSRKPCRCQAMTVSRLTKMRVVRHPVSTRESTTQSQRSACASCNRRGGERCSTCSWCRKASISSWSAARDRAHVRRSVGARQAPTSRPEAYAARCARFTLGTHMLNLTGHYRHAALARRTSAATSRDMPARWRVRNLLRHRAARHASGCGARSEER